MVADFCGNLSPKTATVAEKCGCRRIQRVSPFSRRFRRQSPLLRQSRFATVWAGLYAPAYLTELCTPVIQSRSSCRLRSSYRNRLAVPSVKLTLGSRSFSVSGPTVWNALPDYLRNPTLSTDVFKRYLKTFLFAQY